MSSIKETQMRKYRMCKMWFMALPLLVLMAGCGRQNVIVDLTPPFVTATTPAQGATLVAFSPVISATFSEAMTASTISGTTFTLLGPAATPVAGVVAYSGNIATFTPGSPLAPDTTYTGMISAGVKDLAGNSMVSNHAWTFTTRSNPHVISTIPANGATGVPLNQLLSATFSEAMQA
jgi:hypothetical protein